MNQQSRANSQFHSPTVNFLLASQQATWYPDTTVTNHIAPNSENLSIADGYKGLDQLVVGNGQGL